MQLALLVFPPPPAPPPPLAAIPPPPPIPPPAVAEAAPPGFAIVEGFFFTLKLKGKLEEREKKSEGVYFKKENEVGKGGRGGSPKRN